MISVDEALGTILDATGVLGDERVLLDQAVGRIASEHVESGRAVPAADNSAMDGFAVRAADCAGASASAPAVLPLRGESRAGDAVQELRPGTAMAIMTGAALPRGADSVVRIEDTAPRDGTVEIRVAVTPGTDVRHAGEDITPGTVVVPAGRRLRAVDIAACATAGWGEVPVRRRPRVALLSGGDELVPPGVEPLPHQVVDSNGPMLAAAIAEAGGEPVVQGVVADDPESVHEALERASECDLIVSSAGVSVGAHDQVRAAVEALGSVDVWRIAIRPGKPLLLGDVRGTPLLGLPGNPVSSAVTFELFGRPAILTLQGAETVWRRRVAVRLAEDVSTPEHLETYVRVRLESGEDAVPVAHLSGPQGSAMLRSLADAHALVVVPQGVGRCAAGSVVSALEMG